MRPFSMKLLKAGIASAAMMAMMLITTRSSMSVKPRRSIDERMDVFIYLGSVAELQQVLLGQRGACPCYGIVMARFSENDFVPLRNAHRLLPSPNSPCAFHRIP